MSTTKQPRGKKGVTLKNIADQAKVSVKTVSYALRGSPVVAPETARRIELIADELGYHLSHRPREGIVGLILPHINHLFHTDMTHFIRKALLNNHDLVTLVGETEGFRDIERRVISDFNERGVDALILISPRIRGPEIERRMRLKQPIVTVNMPVGEDSPFGFGSIEVDNTHGASEMVNYLIRENHQRIVYLAGHSASASAKQRREGYLRALPKHGERQQHIVEINPDRPPSFGAGYEQCREALARVPDLDAIVAYNDLMAIGALQALTEQGYQVPQRVSVVGFDNVQLGRYSSPAITTMGVRPEQMAEVIVDTLVRMLQEPGKLSPNELHHVLVPEFEYRQSVYAR